ncbi:GerW family sporulation protein [Christensenellaceae bacterium 44-20]
MHPIEHVLNTTMSELGKMVDVNTIVGNPFVTPDGCTIIPISKVSFGFVTGGGEYGEGVKAPIETRYPFAGGTASGVTITPVAFMVEKQDQIKLLTATERDIVDKILESIPQMASEMRKMFEQGKAKGENSAQSQG